MQVNPAGGLARSLPQASSGRAGFADMLARAIEGVNRQEIEAQKAALLLASGEISDIHTVAIAAQKAELALDLTLAVRNKVLEAYQEIMRMQV